MKWYLVNILLLIPSYYSNAQPLNAVLAKISVRHQPWHRNENAGASDTKIISVSVRHKMMLQQFTDSSIAFLTSAMHQPVNGHDDKFQDIFFKAFTSNKKIIRRSHADYGFVITASMNSHSDVFGTLYLEPYVIVRIEMKDVFGNIVWKKEGYEDGTSAPANNFNAPNGRVYTEEICGYDGAMQLFSKAMTEALATFNSKSLSLK